MQKREIETLKSDKLKKTVIPLGLATLFVFVMILMGPSHGNYQGDLDPLRLLSRHIYLWLSAHYILLSPNWHGGVYFMFSAHGYYSGYAYILLLKSSKEYSGGE